MATIAESVSLSRDEALLREFIAIDKQYFPFLSVGAEGRIGLTNKRVIGRAELKVLGGQRIEYTSVPLDKVEGISLSTGSYISWIYLAIGAVLAIISIIGFIAVDNGIALKVIALLVGIILIVMSFRSEITIGVRTAYIGKRGLISRADPEGYLLLSQSGFKLFKVQGSDTDRILKGLDSILLDIKERGETVIQDIKCPNQECRYTIKIGETPPKHCPECGKAWGDK